jgi:phage/plasmid-like protein (TIGR03299 family)
MAHNLNIENGRASMMYVGETPWHELGTRLEHAPKTAAEAMQAANLNWDVGLKPVYCMDGGVYYEIPEKKAVVRLDKWGQPDCTTFALVGNDYQVFQNRDAFGFFDPLIATGKVSYETAGALGSGERVWVLGKVDSEMDIRGDKVNKYLLFSTGHDARTALQIRFTPVRVVCQNTLVISLQGKGDLSKIYHIPGMDKRVRMAQEEVQKVLGIYDKIETTYNQFAVKQLTTDELKQYLEAVFPDPKLQKGQLETRRYKIALQENQEIREFATKLFNEGIGNDKPPIQGTLWAAYNGIVEMVDHHQRHPNRWKRLEYICFGEGQKIKQLAFEKAKAFLGLST